MGAQPDAEARMATGMATWLVVGAFIAASSLLAVAATRAVHRAPIAPTTPAPRPSP
jgi:hypothetical protein